MRISENLVKTVECAVIGGGQAGISLSYYLQNLGINHLVFERDQPFSAWRNRWNDFRTNTPAWMNTLPFLDRQTMADEDGFPSKEEMISYFEDCLEAVHPPLLSETEVTGIEAQPDGSWIIDTGTDIYRSLAVALCNGAMSLPHLPRAASDLRESIPQFHSSEFRTPDQISTGGVLVVGSASSGVQITRLLCASAVVERLHVASSKVLVLPHRILGVPTHRLIHRLGLFDIKTTSWLGRLMYSGLESSGDPIMRPTPTDLSRDHGIDVRGRFTGVKNGQLTFEDGSRLDTNDLTVIWCTGFRPDYRFVRVQDQRAAFHPSGHPKHLRGVSEGAQGLYFVGLRYQHTVASHDIYGVAQDAEFVAQRIQEQLKRTDTGDWVNDRRSA